MWAGGEGVLLEHAWSAACACLGTPVRVSAHVCVLRSVCIYEEIYIFKNMYMCISEPTLHACETAASLCCSVSQRVQLNEPAQQS